jgi:hypothetical protein
MVLKNIFNDLLLQSQSSIENRVGRMGKTVHTAMVSFTALHDADYITKVDIDKFCENVMSSYGIRDNLHKELSDLYDACLP